MPGKGTKATSKKRRVAVKDLPAAKKKVGSKQMKGVKGGFVLCRTNQGGIVLCKTSKG
jgi:hypothetical protein